jgi:hypothetical protein
MTTATLPADPATLSPPFGSAPNRLHDTAMAAALLSSTPGTLEQERMRRRWRLPYLRMGRKIAYREADLLAFLDRCRVQP